MMISDYENDEAMAKYGRACAKHKAIREHKEAIRTIAVSFQNDIDANGAENLKNALNEHIDALIVAINLRWPLTQIED